MRVRLAQIENCDLNLFDFDYDSTFMVFFLNADEEVYGRYGGRDANGPDATLSIAGLRYAMSAALRTHELTARSNTSRKRERPKFIRQFPSGKNYRGCIHCHQVQEIMDDELKRKAEWTLDSVFRYPPTEKLGFSLEVDRGNVIKRVELDSPASQIGLMSRDVIMQINGMQVHSLADASFALDRAPKVGRMEIVWKRNSSLMTSQLHLAEGWRRSDISWRPSQRSMVPSARLYGVDLTAAEKNVIGLSARRLAFRQTAPVHSQARSAGIQVGDIILGVDKKELEMDALAFLDYARRNYIVGERVMVDVLRDGHRLALPMVLRTFE